VTFPQDTPALWRSSLFAFGVVILIIILVSASAQFAPIQLSQAPQVIPNIVSALLPSLVWLLLIIRLYSQDQIDISPLMPTVFVLGALLAAAIVRPLLHDLLELDDWFSRTNGTNRFAGSVLVEGAINALALYAIVRYTVWRTPNFARRTDGPLFAIAAGWGYGSMFALLFVLDRSGVTIMNGTLRTVSQLFAYLASALIIGYALGRSRFEELPIYYLAAGVGLAAFINGLMLYGSTELNNTGLGIGEQGFSPWPGLVFSLLALILVYAAVFGLTRRHNALTRARQERHE
jgi:RsiW-degrading membrane proteinase PrsW (M82 family)